MDFGNLVRKVLEEGYMKLTQEVSEFLTNIFVPKLKQTTLNYKGVLVFDILKAAKMGNYEDVYESDQGGYEFTYKLNYKNLTIILHYTNLRTSAWAEFDNTENIIIIYIPCVSVIEDNQFLSNFKSKSFDSNSLAELERQFKRAYNDINTSYLPHMQKGATYQRTMANIEHELIHAIDPASHQSKDDSPESLEKYREKYLGDYYGTPERNAGKIPAEFNPFFWNIVRSFEKPLNSKTREFLLNFIKNPKSLINKLKLFDIKAFNIGTFSAQILSLFKENNKDYTSFIRILNDKHHRKLILRVFEDEYLKKKFLQKLYNFVENN